jgi:hypothetical protein
MSALPYGDALLSVGTRLDDLEAALALWETRDDTQPQSDIRQAANDAMDAIDVAMGRLYDIRERLAGEIRASDDAAAARADALLKRIRQERRDESEEGQ